MRTIIRREFAEEILARHAAGVYIGPRGAELVFLRETQPQPAARSQMLAQSCVFLHSVRVENHILNLRLQLRFLENAVGRAVREVNSSTLRQAAMLDRRLVLERRENRLLVSRTLTRELVREGRPAVLPVPVPRRAGEPASLRLMSPSGGPELILAHGSGGAGEGETYILVSRSTSAALLRLYSRREILSRTGDIQAVRVRSGPEPARAAGGPLPPPARVTLRAPGVAEGSAAAFPADAVPAVPPEPRSGGGPAARAVLWEPFGRRTDGSPLPEGPGFSLLEMTHRLLPAPGGTGAESARQVRAGGSPEEGGFPKGSPAPVLSVPRRGQTAAPPAPQPAVPRPSGRTPAAFRPAAREGAAGRPSRSLPSAPQEGSRAPMAAAQPLPPAERVLPQIPAARPETGRGAAARPFPPAGKAVPPPHGEGPASSVPAGRSPWRRGPADRLRTVYAAVEASISSVYRTGYRSAAVLPPVTLAGPVPPERLLYRTGSSALGERAAERIPPADAPAAAGTAGERGGSAAALPASAQPPAVPARTLPARPPLRTPLRGAEPLRRAAASPPRRAANAERAAPPEFQPASVVYRTAARTAESPGGMPGDVAFLRQDGPETRIESTKETVRAVSLNETLRDLAGPRTETVRPEAIADQIYRVLERRLRSERMRKGLL